MIVEVVAVGTELLLGEIVNSNVATIGQRLAADGFDAHYQVTVGDNTDRLTDAIRVAADRADAVVLTGGIGPTQDDLTREAICEVTGVEMLRDEQHAEHIRQRLLAARGTVAETTLRMADYPARSEPLPNRVGVALGVAAELDGTPIFAMPGVPSEMAVMLDEQVMPRLRAASGEPAVLKSRIIRTWGFGESQVAEMFDDLYQSTNPSVAFLINASEVRIRVSAKAESGSAADAMIAEVESAIVDRLGDAVFGYDDDVIEKIVVRMLREKRWQVATVETSTLGELASRIASTADGELVFAGGVVLPPGPPPDDIGVRAEELLAEATVDAGVVVAVSEISGEVGTAGTGARKVGVAVRTPTGTSTHTIGLLGDDARARRFSVPGALHALRLAIGS